MKCFGYTKNDADTLSEFSEVTFQTNSDDLRRLAKFLLQCADEMENTPDWEHEHFDGDKSDTDVIVFNENSI